MGRRGLSEDRRGARNSRGGRVSGPSVHTCSRGGLPLSALLVLSILLAAPGVALAQSARSDTGYELALSGGSLVRTGHDARFRGVAYRVRGLSTLTPYVGEVRAQFVTATQTGEERAVRTDANGRFEISVPIPRSSGAQPRLAVEVGDESDDESDESAHARRFELPLSVTPGSELLLYTDRVLYEPGEPVHVWGLLRDLASSAPLAHQVVRYEVEGPAVGLVTREVETGVSGVASFDLTLGEHATEGSLSVRAHVLDVDRTAYCRVGQRTWERLFAHAEIEPAEVAPGAEAIVHVVVTTPDATPVRDAAISIDVAGDFAANGVTDAAGEARIAVHAPAYLSGDVGSATAVVHVSHPAHGSIDVRAHMQLAVPLSLSVDVIAAHGTLVPEIDDVVFVQLRDPTGHPPPAGTVVEVSGAAIPGGSAQARTDVNGLAELAVRLPLGASAGPYEERRASLSVHVLGGALERMARVEVPVSLSPEIVPTLAHPVVAPGARVDVALARRGAVRGQGVLVELLDARSEIVDVVHVGLGASSARVTVPNDRLGTFSVRARVEHADESLEGVGALAPLLVVPAHPDFVSLVPERVRWQVGERARVDLVAQPNGARAWGALLVRDLAAHGGERDFTAWYLEREFDEALLHPEDAVGERLVRASLAAFAGADGVPSLAPPVVDALGLPVDGSEVADGAPDRDVLRDPWPLARELERRGIGVAMNALEARLADALTSGALDDVTTGRGAQRRFADDLLDPSEYPTLGEGTMTAAMITAVDPSFTYESVARRVARVRLVALLSALAVYLDPGDDASLAARTAYREPWQRWLARMVERGVIPAEALDDPWGGRFALSATAHPTFMLSTAATGVELVSPGPDGRVGTSDDVRDPFARVVTAGTPYAVASGEDALMRQLAVLSPVERTLPALRAAYRRISAEMTEDLIGDAVHASVSEGTLASGELHLSGTGAGGGGEGYGYGGGRGSISTIGHGSGATIVSGGTNLARLVRERFPPTVLFTPSFALDPSGRTHLEIPLADAVTTYRVEVIVWREDGWIWSARTEITSDREIVVDAPIPERVRLGDRLVLPLRVSNRGTSDRTLRVQLLGDETIGVPDGDVVEITVPAGGARAVPFLVAPTIRASGSLRVVASDADGRVVDAVRRPLEVVRPGRTVHVTRDALVEGNGALAFDVPAEADGLSGQLSLVVGTALFDDESGSLYAAWAGSPRPRDILAAETNVANALELDDPTTLAFAIGAAYTRPVFDDEDLRAAAERLTTALSAIASPDARLPITAQALLGLSPVSAHLGERPALAEDLSRLVERLAREVADAATLLDGDTAARVLAAAALARTGTERGRARAAELLRRAEPDLVAVGDELWVAVEQDPAWSTLAFAAAELALGHRQRAFALLRTVARWRARGRSIGAAELALARSVSSALAEGATPDHVSVSIDDTRFDRPLLDGRDLYDDPALAAPGAHRVDVDAGPHASVHASIDLSYAVPWDVPPEREGPYMLALEGDARGQDEVSAQTLVVTNRSPRWIASTVVEIALPTGAELTATALEEVRDHVRNATATPTLLRVTLHSLAPGAEARIPLPVRWSIAGTLDGIGVAAWATDREDAVSLLLPRPTEIAPLVGGAP